MRLLAQYLSTLNNLFEIAVDYYREQRQQTTVKEPAVVFKLQHTENRAPYHSAADEDFVAPCVEVTGSHGPLYYWRMTVLLTSFRTRCKWCLPNIPWCLPFPLLLSGLVALGLYHACKCMYILGYSFYCMLDKVLLLVRCDLKVLFSFCVL